jgi:imidazoleglycerol-phosphate dehydratase/histidinol-phosphatase
MQKVLFIDRDGTLVIEPPIDYQLDSLEKLEFYPGVFRNLAKIVEELDYKLVMVTNQDGLGTDSFPEDTFWPAHNKMLQAFKNEGIEFDEILIDRSFPEDNAPTRKPRTGLVTHYMNGEYDLENSFVLGDRWSDIELAKNMGAKGIYLQDDLQGLTEKGLEESCALASTDWKAIYQFLKAQQARSACIRRQTKETSIEIRLDLDGSGKSDNQTGIGFFDHMLDQLAKHSGCDLQVKVNGDLEVDEHHTIEDTALALGQAFREALGDKRGIARYGHFLLPMDDCLAQLALDFGGRPWLVWQADFKREKVGGMPTEMFEHFFKSFCDSALCNINIKAEGRNEHHKIEAIFKAWAKAIKVAITRKAGDNSLATTKGVL